MAREAKEMYIKHLKMQFCDFCVFGMLNASFFKFPSLCCENFTHYLQKFSVSQNICTLGRTIEFGAFHLDTYSPILKANFCGQTYQVPTSSKPVKSCLSTLSAKSRVSAWYVLWHQKYDEIYLKRKSGQSKEKCYIFPYAFPCRVSFISSKSHLNLKVLRVRKTLALNERQLKCRQQNKSKRICLGNSIVERLDFDFIWKHVGVYAVFRSTAISYWTNFIRSWLWNGPKAFTRSGFTSTRDIFLKVGSSDKSLPGCGFVHDFNTLQWVLRSAEAMVEIPKTNRKP